MDGAYVNGYIRPKNRKEDRINRHKAEIVIIIVRLLHNSENFKYFSNTIFFDGL